ncbi:hypothetical protein L6452_37434 [Arctium lappa]|uniref:Uncharacterized protein n=1 Tax=Arctium lappa TaxID=4217 RepID=A0ACB8Y2Z4_ARCLA|nr:hypothetical protein L6452_37434 [Arctium lappa]
MANQEQNSADSSRIVPSLNLVQFDVLAKENKYDLDITPSKYDEQFRPVLEFFSKCELNYALIAYAQDVPLHYVLQWWYSSEYIEEQGGLVGYIDLGDLGINIWITPDTFTRCLCLPTTREHQIQQFEKPPSTEGLLQFLQHLGYNKEITRLSQFKRQHFPLKWNFMLSVLNRTLTCKIGSQDQTHPTILAIMYALFFNRGINMANILLCELLTVVDKKNKDLNKGKQPISVFFPRIISLMIQRAMERKSFTEECWSRRRHAFGRIMNNVVDRVVVRIIAEATSRLVIVQQLRLQFSYEHLLMRNLSSEITFTVLHQKPSAITEQTQSDH